MTLFVLCRENITFIPIICFYFLNGYVVMYWLSCLYIPLYKDWLYYNLSYVSVTRLGGDLPGNWAWKSLAMLYGYVIVRMVETYIRDYRVFQTARKIMKESGLDYSAMDVINTYNIERILRQLIIGEDFLLQCVMSSVEFIQLLITLVF
jgi:hypothetical protein